MTGQTYLVLKCALGLKTKENAVAKVSKNNEKIAEYAIAHPMVTPLLSKSSFADAHLSITVAVDDRHKEALEEKQK